MKVIVGLFLIWAVPIVGQARNVRVTNDGLVVATQGSGGLLVQRGAQTPVEIPLPPSVANFDDVSIDRADFLFALSTRSRTICSYARGTNDSFSLVGCVAPPGLGVSPFTQMSAVDGVCVVSGGTVGMTLLDYDVQTGQIESSPRVQNTRFPSIWGAPGVRLLNGELAAMATDFFGSEFGTVLVDLENLVETRSFFVQDSLGFSASLGSTNFPIVNTFYEDSSSGATTMYTANGGVTAQDPFQDGAPTVITVPTFPGGHFRAVSVDVDQERDLLVVGGFLQDSMQNMVLQYDVSGNPLSPALLSSAQVAGRVTSVGANGGVIAYVGPDVNGIGLVAPPTGSPSPVAPPTPPPVDATTTTTTVAIPDVTTPAATTTSTSFTTIGFDDWFDSVADRFVGTRLRRCARRIGTPPGDGVTCSRRPKTCFFGNQQCPDGTIYPATRCFCNREVWSCDDSPCPATPTSTFN